MLMKRRAMLTPCHEDASAQRSSAAAARSAVGRQRGSKCRDAASAPLKTT